MKVGYVGLLNMMNLNQTSIHKEYLFCTFKNGSAGVLNFKKRKLEFLSEPNHAETIFETAFKPTDKNILASASFDGKIKIWNVDGMQCISTFGKQASIDLQIHSADMAQFKKFAIYSISWHPKENKIASGDADGDLTVWDCDKGRLLDKVTPGSHNPIFKVDWNPNDPSQIASGSSDAAW